MSSVAIAPTQSSSTRVAAPRALITVMLAGFALLFSLAFAEPAAAELDDKVENYWGVEGIQANTTTNVASHIFAIEQIDNTIYVGGKFLEVGPVGSNTNIAQPFIAAFHADTGVWIDWWNPQFDGPVYALEASADGSRLYVGGEFSTVDGSPRNTLAVLDPATGAIDTSWNTTISGRSNVIRALEIAGSKIYIGGSFDTVTRPGATTSVKNATRIDTGNGVADNSWKPQLDGGGVWGLAESPNYNRVYITGFFTSVDGVTQRGWAAVNSSNGANIASLSYEHNDDRLSVQYLHDVVVAGGNVFIGGSQHHTVVMDEANWTIRWSHVTNKYDGEANGGGDTQDLEVWQGRVYVSCHCYGHVFSQPNSTIHLRVNDVWIPPTTSDRRPVRAMYALDANTGARIDSFQPQVSGIAGPWALEGHSTDGCLWSGGQFTQVDGSARKHLTRMCDSAGPGPSAGPKLINPSTLPTAPLACTVTQTDHDQVRVDWIRADGDLADKYVVHRSKNNASYFWAGAPLAPAASFTNGGLAPGNYRYIVHARSATALSAPTTCDPSGGIDIEALTCGGQPVTIAGSFGDDVINGTSGVDVISGLAGNDQINGLSGNDIICGGDGNDTISAGNGDDLVGAGFGDDTVSGGSGDDRLYGGDDDDTITGGTGDDLLHGSNGNDDLRGEDGDDTLVGLDGTDVLGGGDGADLVNGGSGNDTIYGGSGYDALVGGFGWDRVYGGNGNDFISGGSGNDILDGGYGWDTISGGNGNDDIEGGHGRDTLRGGLGDDSITGGHNNDLLFGDAGNDRLTDTDGDDVLHGSTGNDVLIGGAGANTLFGGSGNDTCSGAPQNRRGSCEN